MNKKPVDLPGATVVFPGSFDPLTTGHIDIISRALTIFHRVIVAVLLNPQKECFFSIEEREAIINEACAEYGGSVTAISFSGLLVDFMKSQNTRLVLRGLRAVSDYEYETQLALMNRHLDPQIETCFLMASADCTYISSSVVKQIAKFGGDVSGLVPPATVRAFAAKLGNNIKV